MAKKKKKKKKPKQLVAIILGNSFPVKEELKELGFRWDGETRRWHQEIELEEVPEFEEKVGKIEGVSLDVDDGEMILGATPWVMEPARSSRSTCKECGSKIQKGDLRLGQGDRFQESDYSYKWHHMKCAAEKFPSHIERIMDCYDGDIPDRDEILADL